MFKLTPFKVIQSLLVTAALVLFSTSVSAGMLQTERLLPQLNSGSSIDQARRSIEQQLIELGVAKSEAAQRVRGLSDQQIADIDQRLAELPAGADAAGILLTIFIVFVITDVIGATDIFPFIHPVTR